MAWADGDQRAALAFQALGDPTRRAIVRLLAVRESLPGGEIARQFEMAWSSVSRHLGLLRDADLVTASRHGRHILYALNRPTFALLAAELGDIAAPRVRTPMPGFTGPLRRCLAAATDAARHTRSPSVTPGHLLLGLLRVDGTRAAAALRAAGVDHDAVVPHVPRGEVRPGGRSPRLALPDVASWRLLQRLLVVGARRRQTVIGPGTLLDVLLEESDEVADLLRAVGVEVAAVRRLAAAGGTRPVAAGRPDPGGVARTPDVVAQLAALRGGVQALERLLVGSAEADP